jgi:membrane associated rhomboid family serine protease
MVTAVFAHGGWGHLIGNLFFFFAFAATVEGIIGPILFPVVIIGLSFGTQIAFSLWAAGTGNMVPTLGLSGVVMGMIGLFTYFLPTAGIRCFVWAFVWAKTFAIPAWIITTWYVGWDIYNLSQDDGSAGVNFMAHVSGAVLGLLSGMLFFRGLRDDVRQEFVSASGRRGAKSPT